MPCLLLLFNPVTLTSVAARVGLKVALTLIAVVDVPARPKTYYRKTCVDAQGLFVRTVKGVLLEIHPQVRLPRTFKRFCGLMVQLLQKFSIHATNGSSKLLKVCCIP